MDTIKNGGPPPGCAQAAQPADVALLQRALGALEYHREQTRPIAQTDAVIEALRTALAAKGSDVALTQAARDVLAERQRQIEVEGWTPEHDDEHSGGGLAVAAACYATAYEGDPVPSLWPWEDSWWKPKDRRSNRVRACALILAEIERLDRAALAAKGADHA